MGQVVKLSDWIADLTMILTMLIDWGLKPEDLPQELIGLGKNMTDYTMIRCIATSFENQ